MELKDLKITYWKTIFQVVKEIYLSKNINRLSTHIKTFTNKLLLLKKIRKSLLIFQLFLISILNNLKHWHVSNKIRINSTFSW